MAEEMSIDEICGYMALRKDLEAAIVRYKEANTNENLSRQDFEIAKFRKAQAKDEVINIHRMALEFERKLEDRKKGNQ